MTDEPCTRCTVGMSECDRAAVDVESLIRNAEPIPAVQDLNCEGFVELPQVDLLEAYARALEQSWHREDRTDSHLVGLAAGDGKAAENAERLDAPALCELPIHDDAGARAVGELAGVTRRDDASRDRWADLRDACERRIRSDALIR